MRTRLKNAFDIHYATFKTVVLHLARVAANFKQNRMDPQKISIYFTPILFGDVGSPEDIHTLRVGVRIFLALDDDWALILIFRTNSSNISYVTLRRYSEKKPL